MHWGLGSIIYCSNDDPGLTLPYFTARSNSVNACFSIGEIENNDFFQKLLQSVA